MSRSKRSSRVKANNAALKANVFAPYENARTQRLSRRQQERAGEPTEEQAERAQMSMEVEDTAATTEDTNKDKPNEENDSKFIRAGAGAELHSLASPV
jgi:ribosome biogenesis factor-like protein